tara:strand:+ start:51 stop:1214 length:1164 start_codon:yes stop_codon:yes gene_type:complete
MGNKIFDYNKVLEGVIGNKLQGLLAPKQKYTGLLDFAKSDYAGDIGMGLLAQSGYSAMPTNLGASVGTAVSNADQLRTQRRANEFTELGALSNIYNNSAKSTNPNSYKEYLLTDGTPTNEEYKIFLDRNKTIPKAETPRSYQTPDGNVLTITNSEFNQLDPAIRQKLIPFETTTTTNLLEGEIKPLAEFQEQMIRFENAGILTNKVLALLEDPNTLTASIPKATVSLISNLRETIGQSLELFSDDERKKKITESDLMSNNKDLITEIVVQTGLTENLLVTLAYQRALINNPDGRISDKDFKFAMESLKGISSNKESLKAIVIDNMDTANKYAQNSFNKLQGFNIFKEGDELSNYYNFYEPPSLNNLEPNTESTNISGGSITIDLETY